MSPYREPADMLKESAPINWRPAKRLLAKVIIGLAFEGFIGVLAWPNWHAFAAVHGLVAFVAAVGWAAYTLIEG